MADAAPATPPAVDTGDQGATPPATPPEGDQGATPPATPPPAADPPATPPAADPTAWLTAAPDDWREAIAGEDKSRLNHLSRVTTPQQLMDNYFAAQEKIRTGSIEAAKVPDEHSTDQEWAEYREANNIPAKPEDYSLELAEGLVIGDEDQEILDQVYPIAHQMNLPTEAVNGLVNAMMSAQAQQFHQADIQQGEYQKEADAIVRNTWRGDYETNKNLIESTFIAGLPEAVRDEFAHAVLPNGRKLFNSPEILIAMADWARKLNPAATVVPNNANPMQAIESEIAGLEKEMGTPDWYADSGKQKRYMDLIAARDNLKQQR